MSLDKVLFLDMDGVMNADRDFLPLGPKTFQVSTHPVGQFQTQLLSDIIVKTRAKIVISSTWRHHWSIPQFNAVFSVFTFWLNDWIVGITPCKMDATRGQEIEMWIKENNFTGKFVILDDENDMEPFMDHLIQTETSEGLGFRHADRAIEMLGEI